LWTSFARQDCGARVLLRRVDDPERYGIAALDELKIIEIEEKPAQPKSAYALLEFTCMNQEVFNIIRTIKPSDSGEYEITSVNNDYIQRNCLQ
jgi:glucose-1-phosphate thymidylyltransferase